MLSNPLMCFSYSFLATPFHNLSSPILNSQNSPHSRSLLLCPVSFSTEGNLKLASDSFFLFYLTKLYTYFFLTFNKEELKEISELLDHPLFFPSFFLIFINHL